MYCTQLSLTAELVTAPIKAVQLSAELSFQGVTHVSRVVCLLSSINLPQESGIFELTVLQIVNSCNSYLCNEKAEQSLHRELQSGCGCGWKPQGMTTAHCLHRPLVCPVSRDKTESYKAQNLCLTILLVPFMAFEISFDSGCGTGVAFGSAQSRAMWQPLCTSLLLHWQGWMKHGFYCYSLVQLPTTFPEAKKVCEENKGYLATVRDRYGNIIIVL